MHALEQIRRAIRHLDPDRVREEAARPVEFPLEDLRDASAEDIREILLGYPEISLSLARRLESFRKPVTDRIIQEVSRENGLFALVTALPAVIPSLFSISWAAGEFASDTAVLTMNQVRMAFLIAAAHDRPVGYIEQKSQIASIIASAFGWRAIARELAGKIPLGEGLIPKAAIAYAGTYVVGMSLERYHRAGSALSKSERAAAYREAIESGKRLARWALRHKTDDADAEARIT